MLCMPAPRHAQHAPRPDGWVGKSSRSGVQSPADGTAGALAAPGRTEEAGRPAAPPAGGSALMPRSLRCILALVGFVTAAAGARAQTDLPGDRPRVLPPDPPAARADLDHREAVKLYGVAVIREREQRLVEAVRTLEQAARLDPESARVWRALVPLYLALDRGEDALAACKKALDLEPGDFETWYRYARQLRLRDRPQDAVAALKRAAAC